MCVFYKKSLLQICEFMILLELKGRSEGKQQRGLAMAYRIQCNNTKTDIKRQNSQQHYQISLRKNDPNYLTDLCGIISKISAFSFESIYKYAQKNPYKNIYYMSEEEIKEYNNNTLIRRKTPITDKSFYIVLKFNMKMFLQNFVKDVVKNPMLIALITWIRETPTRSYFYLVLRNISPNKLDEIEAEITRICSNKDMYNKYGGIKVVRSVYWPENIDSDIKNEDKYLYRGNFGVCWKIQDVYKDFIETTPYNWVDTLKSVKTPERLDDLAVFTDLEIEQIEVFVSEFNIDYGKYSPKYKYELKTMFFATLSEILARGLTNTYKIAEYGLNDVYAMIKNTNPSNEYAEYRFWNLFLAPNLQKLGFRIENNTITQHLTIPSTLIEKIYGTPNYTINSVQEEDTSYFDDLEPVE